MKSEIFPILFDKQFDEFLEKNELTYADFTKKIKGPIGQEFRDMIKNRETGMCNETIRTLCTKAPSIGLDQELCFMIHDAIMDLAIKKMKQNNSLFSKLEQMLEKTKCFGYPEEFDFENLNYKAILKIKIPMVEESTGEGEDGDGSEMEDNADYANPTSRSPKESQKEEGEGEEGEPKETTRTNKEPPKLIEAKLEDKVLMVNPNGAEDKVYTIHEYAGRMLREDIALNVKKLTPGYEDVNIDDMLEKVETLASKVEQWWIDSTGLPCFDFEIN
jgi:hypothetical protein